MRAGTWRKFWLATLKVSMTLIQDLLISPVLAELKRIKVWHSPSRSFPSYPHTPFLWLCPSYMLPLFSYVHASCSHFPSYMPTFLLICSLFFLYTHAPFLCPLYFLIPTFLRMFMPFLYDFAFLYVSALLLCQHSFSMYMPISFYAHLFLLLCSHFFPSPCPWLMPASPFYAT